MREQLLKMALLNQIMFVKCKIALFEARLYGALLDPLAMQGMFNVANEAELADLRIQLKQLQQQCNISDIPHEMD